MTTSCANTRFRIVSNVGKYYSGLVNPYYKLQCNQSSANYTILVLRVIVLFYAWWSRHHSSPQCKRTQGHMHSVCKRVRSWVHDIVLDMQAHCNDIHKHRCRFSIIICMYLVSVSSSLSTGGLCKFVASNRKWDSWPLWSHMQWVSAMRRLWCHQTGHCQLY